MKELLEKYERIVFDNEEDFIKEFLKDYPVAWDDVLEIYFGSYNTEVKFLISSGETCVDYIKTDRLLEWCEHFTGVKRSEDINT